MGKWSEYYRHLGFQPRKTIERKTMSAGEDTRRFTAGGISLDDRLESIDISLREIRASITEEKTAVALIQSKLALHDTILMGVCGLVGSSVIVAVLAMVFRKD